MMKNIVAACSMALLASVAHAQEAVSPFADVEGGKLKRISIHKLTPKVKQLVQEDLNQDAFAPVRVMGSIPDDAIIYKELPRPREGHEDDQRQYHLRAGQGGGQHF